MAPRTCFAPRFWAVVLASRAVSSLPVLSRLLAALNLPILILFLYLINSRTISWGVATASYQMSKAPGTWTARANRIPGIVFLTPWESEGRRHRRCRLRFLPSLQGRHSHREKIECEKLPLFDLLAAHPADAPAKSEPEGFGLQAPGRITPRQVTSAASHFVSLGFAATVAGCRWLAESQYGGPLHGIIRNW